MRSGAEAWEGLPVQGPSQEPPNGAHRGLWPCLLDYQRTHMALRNFAKATRRGYASDLSLFMNYLLEMAGVATVEEINRRHLHDYFADLDRQCQAGATRARKLAAIKSFFAYLEDSGVIDRNPARGIPRP
jgi:site-specific recombinase XerD